VLIAFSREDHARFLTAPLATVQSVIARELGLTLAHLTLASGPDRDFSSPELPRPMVNALQAGGDVAGEHARQRAMTEPQSRTLALEAARNEELPLEELTRAQQMTPAELARMSSAARADWYINSLGRYQAQLFESALRHHLPVQLLATIILNELADINLFDVWQSGPATFGGSLGIAQIQVNTALRDHLVDISPGDARRGYQRSGAFPPASLDAQPSEMGVRLHVAQRLQVPAVAIEAAAREVELLLNRMGQNRDRPWQLRHGFRATGAVGDAIYEQVGDARDSREAREGLLARMVAAAYNSPDVISASDPSAITYPNANIHGDNARARAMELNQQGLFRSEAGAGASRSTTRSPSPEPINALRFDGSLLTLEGPLTTRSVRATSGLRANNRHNADHRDHTSAASELLPDVGPVPHGSYFVIPGEIQYGGFDTSVWGPRRVRLHESAETEERRVRDSQRTGGFYLHEDVGRDGTAGCIGLQSSTGTLELFSRLLQSPQSRIPLTVSYPPARRGH
jgi:hypothetical protein